MSKHFKREVEILQSEIIALGEKVEQQVVAAIESVLERDEIKANRVIAGDKEIDATEVRLEEECLKILALHQPVATDLRYVISVLKINNSLERISDLAVNIAKRERRLADVDNVHIRKEVPLMAEKAKAMLRNSLIGFIERDAHKAREVLAADDEVDELNRDVHRRIIMEIKKSPEEMDTLFPIISIAKNLERIADMASNIAEDVVYFIEGDIIRHGLLGIE